MKRALAILILCALLSLPPAALAAETADIEPGDRGDAVLRAQLRLGDLGYLDADTGGVWRDVDAAALNAFSAAGGKPEALFTEAAPRAAASSEDGAMTALVFGGAMPWSEAKTRLTVGKSYVLTDCYTGVVIRLGYLGGEGYAEMQPVLTWDNATMVSLISGASPLDARPVVLSIDGMLIAASLRACPLVQEEAMTRVQIFFKGSGSSFSGLPDADHAAAIMAATASN